MKEKVNTLLYEAIELRVSDVHFIPNKKKVFIKYRIDGEISTHHELGIRDYEKMIAYMKFISGLDVAERKRAQSGTFEMKLQDDGYNIRISTLPQSIGSEGCVLRLLPVHFRNTALHTGSVLFDMVKLADGLILITGPTGSGKSTLMYQLLMYARDVLGRQIITIEDPVEQILDETLQINVNEKADITYRNSLKAILRCDPDIIMIGEVRDEQTAKQVINASLSGHLVISTLHASSTTGTIERLLEMGIKKSELKQSIRMVANLRLVKVNSERKLVMETMDEQQLYAFIEKNAVRDQLTIGEQIRSLYDDGLIDKQELQKFYVEAKQTSSLPG